MASSSLQNEFCFANDHHQDNMSNNAFQCGKLWRLLHQNILLLRNWCPEGISKVNVSNLNCLEQTINQFETNNVHAWINNWTTIALHHLEDAQNLFQLMLQKEENETNNNNHNSYNSCQCQHHFGSEPSKKRMRFDNYLPSSNNNILELLFTSCNLLILLSRQFNVDPKLIEYDLKNFQCDLVDKENMFLNEEDYCNYECHTKFLEHKFLVIYLEKMPYIHHILFSQQQQQQQQQQLQQPQQLQQQQEQQQQREQLEQQLQQQKQNNKCRVFYYRWL